MSWLAGNPQLDVSRSEALTTVTLSGSRYPGSSVSADFTMTVDSASSPAVVELRHVLASAAVKVPLDEWLRGDHTPAVASSKAFLGIEVGEFLRMRQAGEVQVAFNADLAFRAQRAQGARDSVVLTGTEVAGEVDAAHVGRVSGEPLIEGDSLRRAAWELFALADAPLGMRPSIEVDGRMLRMPWVPVERMRIESAEANGGARHAAFFATSDSAVTISRLAVDGAGHGRVMTNSPSFLRVQLSDGSTESRLRGKQGAGLVTFGGHALQTVPAGPDAQVAIDSAGGNCSVDCGSAPAALAHAAGDGVSVTLRFPRDAKAAAATICPFSLLPRELELEGAVVTFAQPANALYLRMQLFGFALVRHWGGTRLVVTRPDRCRVHVLPGPAEVVEESFFEPPDGNPPSDADRQAMRTRYRAWLVQLYAKGTASAAEQAAMVTQGMEEFERSLESPLVPEWRAAGAFPSRARIAGDTRLVLRLRRELPADLLEHLALTVEKLVDPRAWQMVVVQDAASSETVRKSGGFPAQQSKDRPPHDATSIEAPPALYISPDENAFLTPLGMRAEAGRSQDLFRLLVEAPGAQPVPLRAIGTDVFTEDSLPLHYVPNANPSGFRRPLDSRDRSELVWLTSQWNRAALMGTRDVRARGQGDPPVANPGFKGLYVPQAFHADLLMFTSMGAYLRSNGTWDPPALEKFALSVERWQHSSTLARAHHDVVVYKGFLLPFGIRCSLIKETRREERKLPEMGVISVPVQKFYIEVPEPSITYTGALVPHEGRTWPFSSITLLLKGRLQIDDPTNTGVCNLGQSAFRICVGRRGYGFEFQVDNDPKRRGAAMLAFIDNTVAHNEPALTKVSAALNVIDPIAAWAAPPLACPVPGTAPPSYFIDLLGSKVRYAPPREGDDTSYVTHRMTVRMEVSRELVNSAILEASGKPAVYPQMENAVLLIPALNRLTGRADSTQTTVRTADIYREVGFAGNGTVANDAEIFLTFMTPVQVTFSGKGHRSGAVGSPNIEAHNLSRRIGVTGDVKPRQLSQQSRPLRAAQLKSSVAFDPSSLFRTDAKLLGVLPMSALFDALGLDEVPKFVESSRHRLDVVEADLATKACDFAKTASAVAANIASQLQSQTQFDGAQQLVADLGDFNAALAPIQSCASKGDLEDIVQSIALAGQALDRLHRHAEGILHDPASLLPANVRELIALWTAVLDGFKSIGDNLRTILLGKVQDLRQQLDAAKAELQEYAVAVMREELESAYAGLITALEQFAKSTSASELATQLAQVLSDYEAAYSNALGWYQALKNADVRDALISLGERYLLGTGAGQYLFALQGAAARALTDIDQRLRHWGDFAQEAEAARAFFRREEPVLERASAAGIKLLDATLGPRARVQAAHELSASLDELSDAVQREIAASALRRQPVSYLQANAEQLKKGQAALADVGRRMKGNVQAAVAQLRAQAAGKPELAALDTALQEAQADLDGAIDGAVTGALDVLCRLSAAATYGYQQVSRILDRCDAAARLALDLVYGAVRLVVQKMVDLADPLAAAAVKYSYLFDDKMAADLQQWRQRVQELVALLAGPAPMPASADWAKLKPKVDEVRKAWDAVVQRMKAIGEAPDKFIIAKVRDQVAGLLEQLVPAEVHLEFGMSTLIENDFGSTFLHGGPSGADKSALTLKAKLDQNLLTGASSANFEGELKNFRLNLFNLLVIWIRSVHFEARNGAAPKLTPPDIEKVELGGCLSFIDELKQYFSGGSGPYVLPILNGVRAGYMLRPGVIPVGPMIIQDLVLDAAIEIPFDDRAAVTSFAVSSREQPALLFISPYGGTMYFNIAMAGDRLVNVEASFAAGLVSAFDLGAVVGTGMVTLGLAYHQSADGLTLDGFFYAGGHGTILEVVSMGVSLRIGMVHQGSGVNGYGEFSVELGHKPFAWTLSYSVSKNVARVKGANGGGEPERRLTNLDTPAYESLFLDDATWREFRSAFAPAPVRAETEPTCN